jgi:hypothetical protein
MRAVSEFREVNGRYPGIKDKEQVALITKKIGESKYSFINIVDD